MSITSPAATCTLDQGFAVNIALPLILSFNSKTVNSECGDVTLASNGVQHGNSNTAVDCTSHAPLSVLLCIQWYAEDSSTVLRFVCYQTSYLLERSVYELIGQGMGQFVPYMPLLGHSGCSAVHTFLDSAEQTSQELSVPSAAGAFEPSQHC